MQRFVGRTPQGVLPYKKAGDESNFSLALQRGEVVKLSAEEALVLFKTEVEKSALPQLSKDFPALYAAARSKIATHEQVMPKPSLREVQVRDRVQKAVEGIRMGKGRADSQRGGVHDGDAGATALGADAQEEQQLGEYLLPPLHEAAVGEHLREGRAAAREDPPEVEGFPSLAARGVE